MGGFTDLLNFLIQFMCSAARVRGGRGVDTVANEYLSQFKHQITKVASRCFIL